MARSPATTTLFACRNDRLHNGKLNGCDLISDADSPCVGDQSGGWGATEHSELGRNLQFLSGVHVVWIFKFVFICIEDAHVIVGISIELLADLRQCISWLHDVSLIAGLSFRARHC